MARTRRATLFPGYFAMVMATGIIAIGAAQQELAWLADGLYAIAAVAYVVLVVLCTLAGCVVSRELLAADITSHAKGFAFLTTVAATNVLGQRLGRHPRLVGPGVGAVVGQPRPLGGPASTPRSSPSS